MDKKIELEKVKAKIESKQEEKQKYEKISSASKHGKRIKENSESKKRETIDW